MIPPILSQPIRCIFHFLPAKGNVVAQRLTTPDRQNAHSMTVAVAVRGRRQVLRTSQAGGDIAPSGKILTFSQLHTIMRR